MSIEVETAVRVACQDFSIFLSNSESYKHINGFCICTDIDGEYVPVIIEDDFPRRNGKSEIDHVIYLLNLCYIVAEGQLKNNCECEKYNTNGLSPDEIASFREKKLNKAREELSKRSSVYIFNR